MRVRLRVDVADRDEAVGRVRRGRPRGRAGRRGSRQAASDALLRDAAPRTRTSSPTRRVDEPRRVVVAVAAAGPVDEHGVVARRASRASARRHASCDAARRRALRSFLTAGGHGVARGGLRARPRRVREDVHLRRCRASRDDVAAFAERGLVLGGEADDHVGREVEVRRAARAGAGTSDAGSGGPSRAARRRRRTGAARAGGGATAGVSRSAATRSSSTWLTSIDERRRRASPGISPSLADEARQRVARLAVAEAAEVDPGEDDLAVALRDAAPRISPSTASAAAAARAAADERDRRRSCTRSCSRPGSSRTRARGRGARRPGRSRSRRRRRRRRPASPRSRRATTTTFPGRPAERVAVEVRAAAGHVDAPVRARRARGRLARLRDGLVGDAAGVDDGDVGAASAARRGRRRAGARAPPARPSCETLQPRKRTENVATAARSTPVRYEQSAAQPSRSRRRDAARARGRRGRRAPGSRTVTRRRSGRAARAPRRRRARCSRRRRRRPASASVARVEQRRRRPRRRSRRRSRASTSTAAGSTSTATHRREAELRRRDGEDARAAADVEQAAAARSSASSSRRAASSDARRCRTRGPGR